MVSSSSTLSSGIIDCLKLARLNYVRKFSKEANLAKAFYIALCVQIMLDTVLFLVIAATSENYHLNLVKE